MINRIIGTFFFVDLLIALFIAIYWSTNNIDFHTIKLGEDFMSFIYKTSAQLDDYKFVIPNIPKIDMITPVDNMENANWWDNVLNFFVNFANGFFTFINGVTSVINFVINVVNYIIQLVQFIALLLGNFFNMIGNLQTQPAA